MYIKEGKLYRVEDIQYFKNDFTKREFAIQITERKFAKFVLIKANTSLIDAFQIGDDILVHFDIDGHDWPNKEGQHKIIQDLTCLAIQMKAGSEAKPAATPVNKKEEAKPIKIDSKSTSDNLPF